MFMQWFGLWCMKIIESRIMCICIYLFLYGQIIEHMKKAEVFVIIFDGIINLNNYFYSMIKGITSM
jgi:hypothetical protein